MKIFDAYGRELVLSASYSIDQFLEATPTNGETSKAPNSDWAYDHNANSAKHMDALLSVAGDMLYRTTVPARLPIGTAYQKLRANAGATAPEWVTGSLYVPCNIIMYNLATISSSPRTATVSSVAGQTITLTANVAYKFWGLYMTGTTSLKIHNETRNLYAWVISSGAVNTLTVSATDDITTWVNGDTITTATDGGTSAQIQLKVIDPTVAAAVPSALLLEISCYDPSGAMTNGKGLYINGVDLACALQVQAISMNSMYVGALDASLCFTVWDVALGTDTLNSTVRAIGYFR